MKALRWVGLLFLCFVLLVLWVVAPWYPSVLGHLGAGWIFYVYNTVPQVSWNFEALASGLVFLSLALLGFHYLARGVLRMRGIVWRWKWTFCLSTMFLIVFGVSLAVGGISHQMAWLTRSGDWVVSSRSPVVMSISQAKQITTLLRLYASDYDGKYPEHLDELVQAGLSGAEGYLRIASVASETGEPLTPWVYVSGLTDAAPGDLPVVISPFALKGKSRVIGTNDTRVTLMSEAEINAALPSWREGYRKLGIEMPTILEEPFR